MGGKPFSKIMRDLLRHHSTLPFGHPRFKSKDSLIYKNRVWGSPFWRSDSKNGFGDGTPEGHDQEGHINVVLTEFWALFSCADTTVIQSCWVDLLLSHTLHVDGGDSGDKGR